MPRKSVMKHQFSRVPRAEIPRSKFDRSHGHKTCFDAGKLIPIYVDEAYPSDSFSMSATTFGRLATPIVPVMDNMYLDVHFFAVPIRLLWDNFQRMMGEQDNPSDSTDYTTPQLTPAVGGFTTGGIADYFGLPLDTDNISVSALYHRAVKKIWNDWYRDENLQDSLPFSKGDGPDTVTAGYDSLPSRGKRHDYFTSCLPWPQKSATGVEIPLGDTAPVVTDYTSGEWGQAFDNTGATFGTNEAISATDPATDYLTRSPSGTGMVYDPNGTLVADLSSATAATINSLRQAFQLQRMLERDARGGTRYTELLKSHFGVTDPLDARLQRAEYLGGGTTRINIQPVPQTSPTASDVFTADTPQGNLAGYGTFGQTGIGFHKSFVEHNIIIGLASVRADLTYQRGIQRMFSRLTKHDYYWPALSHIGEQAVLNKEIYAQGTAEDDDVFGYQERFGELRYGYSKITNKFRSTDPQSLDIWHLSQDFTALPTLGATFIEENPPIDRIVATPDEPQFIFDSYFNLKCARPMPVYGVPGMIDHF